MQNKHTQGPWKFWKYLNFWAISSESGAGQVATCTDLNDAKLIAAAPELLEAVKELRNQLLSLQMNIPSIMPLQNEQSNMLSAALLKSEKAIKKATE